MNPIIDPLQGDFPEVIEEFLEHGIMKCISFNRRGTLLAAGCSDGSCVVWDFETRGIAKELRDKDCAAAITSVCWSRNGHNILISAADKSLTLWDVVKGEKIYRITLQQTPLQARLHPLESTLCLICPFSSAPIIVDLRTETTTTLPISLSENKMAAAPVKKPNDSSLPSSFNDDIQKQKYINKKQSHAGNEAWWINGAFVIIVHIVSLLSFLTYTADRKTWVMTFVICQLAMFGITVGYHRLWSHRAYEAELPLRVVLGLLGTLGFQGSIKWWVLRHRLHHRWTDTEHDPYSAAKGFWFSHMGWIFKRPHYPRLKLVDASDLNADPVVRFQHKYYVLLALSCGLGIPTMIASLWGDALGGFLYGGILSRTIIWHSTFCINSFAHWAGEQLYSNEVSARGNLLLAMMTHGEGYHNFHHEFPKDFRNGYRLCDWDPSKWIIFTLHKLTNQVPNVSRVPENEVRKAMVNMEIIKAQEKSKKYDWGIDPSSLPVITYEQYKQKQEQEGKEWILVDEYVLDVSSFKDDHPGGAKILKNYYGKDSTKAFHGGLNDHSKAANTMTAMFRVAKIEKSQKEE